MRLPPSPPPFPSSQKKKPEPALNFMNHSPPDRSAPLSEKLDKKVLIFPCKIRWGTVDLKQNLPEPFRLIPLEKPHVSKRQTCRSRTTPTHSTHLLTSTWWRKSKLIFVQLQVPLVPSLQFAQVLFLLSSPAFSGYQTISWWNVRCH